MASFSCLLEILIFCGFCAFSLALQDHNEDLMAMREKAHYHFQELQKSLEKVSAIQSRSDRIKRDVHLNGDMRKSDFLFDSLLDFCFEIQNFDGVARNFTPEDRNLTTTVPMTPEIPQFNEADDYNWCVPKVRPIGVTASRDGDQVHFRFDVKHSAPARIIRFAGVEHEQIEIDFDESMSNGSKISSASFTLSQISSFCIDGYDSYSNQFIFEKKDDLGVQITLKINACKFDQYREQNIDWQETTWIIKSGPLHENVTSSKILVEPPSTDELVVENGKNQSLELNAEIDNRGYIYFYTIFYDRSTRKLNTNTYMYGVGDRSYREPYGNDSIPWRFLYVEEISSFPTEVNATRMYYEGTWKVKLRITLTTESGRITGKLYISVMDSFGSEYDPSIVKDVTTSVRYLIKKPNRANVFPRRKILMEEENRFICTEIGNHRHEMFGRNCTISCWASGRDLESLKIYRNGSEVSGYRSLSYLVDDRIFTRIDLGPASPALDGAYECTVTDKRSFTKTQKLTMFTYGFPRINTNQSRVEDLGNGTSIVVCYATGVLPINVSIEVHQDTRFSVAFDESVWSQSEMETADGKVLQVILPTDDIRYPSYTVGCQATSDRGEDYQNFDLSGVVGNHTLTIAKIVSDESGIVSYYDNLTTVITCVASGRQPLDVGIAFGDRTNRIDNGTEYMREEYKTKHRTTVRISGDSKAMMQATYWVYCLAKNEYDDDYLRYYLWNYLDTRLIVN